MTLHYIDHYLIRTSDIKKSKKFYSEILGLKEGYRPAFPSSGYWLYLGDNPVVHLIEVAPMENAQNSSKGTGPFGHIAFHADNLEEMVTHLQKFNVAMQHRTVPEEDNVHQIFIVDPDGIRIELNFSQK